MTGYSTAKQGAFLRMSEQDASFLIPAMKGYMKEVFLSENRHLYSDDYKKNLRTTYNEFMEIVAPQMLESESTKIKKGIEYDD